jgi:hypothetical protein
MKQQVITIVKISSIFVGGIIIGAVLMNLLHMYVRSTYRETIRIDLKTEQEFLAGRAARQGDNLRALSHRWNVVDAEARDGFRAFRKERNKDIDSSFFFPFYVFVLKAIKPQMRGKQKEVDMFIEGMDRGKLAVALESIGEKEEAAKQWDIARLLTRQKSIEDIRRRVLGWLEGEKTDLHLQAEKAILEDTHEAQQGNQPDRE